MEACPRPPTPTLDEIRTWPVTVDVARAGTTIGAGRAHSYALVKRGTFPFPVIRVGSRYRVITAELIRVLTGRSSESEHPIESLVAASPGASRSRS